MPTRHENEPYTGLQQAVMKACGLSKGLIMGKYTEQQLDEIRDRRLQAVIDMAKTAYQVDGYGLAEMLGMSKAAWTRSTKSGHWRGVTCKVYFGLCELTGIRPSWIFAEELEQTEI